MNDAGYLKKVHKFENKFQGKFLLEVQTKQ